ncbi:tetratricopeptide repeat protein [Candidatus Thorarchaeota archaeon]|nr:MAG: tetratricopeptide repeat protein [Candidatus Thorarchaeota archaeon]
MRLFGRKNDDKYTEAAKLLADGEVEQALELLRDFLEEHPDHANAHTSLGVALIHFQENPSADSPEIQEAFQHFERAFELDPDDAVPIFNKAVALRDLGRHDQALASFDRVLEVEERNALAVLHKAEINYELENYEEALRLAKLALIRDPALEEQLVWVKDAMRRGGFLDDGGNVIDKPKEDIPEE